MFVNVCARKILRTLATQSSTSLRMVNHSLHLPATDARSGPHWMKHPLPCGRFLRLGEPRGHLESASAFIRYMDRENRAMHHVQKIQGPVECLTHSGIPNASPRRRVPAGATAASHIRFVGVERCLSLPECSPKCAPKVHGAVRAAGYRWHELGSTLAFTHEKTRIRQGIR